MRPRENILQKFKRSLEIIPVPGGGGCHTALLGTANLAALAGLPEIEAFEKIRRAIPQGGRRVSDNEIRQAVCKAFKEHHGQAVSFKIPPKPKAAVTQDAFEKIVEKYKDAADELEVWERSPIRIDWTAGPRDAYELLSQLYRPDEYLFIGDTYGQTVRTVEEWLQNKTLADFPLIIPNPLTGQVGQTKDGKETRRGDNCVANFAFTVAEMDSASRLDQIAFWVAMLDKGLPIGAIVDSGGKSLHAWIAVACVDRAEWESQVERKLFEQYLIPMGCDRACRNESRLSRLPGHFRKEKGRWQRLLYLNPKARAAR
ncbi:MAG: hypothetical protein A2X49_03980 [Lentisphaerae bacterium GWF2_52_8]|nr:MAG: hypothetical protein A2X49_03980 [Lentisphaerae bacterium GWF2_52_8]